MPTMLTSAVSTTPLHLRIWGSISKEWGTRECQVAKGDERIRMVVTSNQVIIMQAGDG
jgi:hypothetical protein